MIQLQRCKVEFLSSWLLFPWQHFCMLHHQSFINSPIKELTAALGRKGEEEKTSVLTLFKIPFL